MIILFSSKLPQQGKDTAVSYLGKMYGVKRIAFADKLKDTATSLGWNGEKDEKGRQFLIDLGLAARKYEQNTWVNLAIKDVKDLIKNGYAVAISDVRFLNEVNKIHEAFTRTKIIHIGINSDTLGDKSRENNESQIDYEKMNFDYTINTTENVSHLYKEIDNILLHINR